MKNIIYALTDPHTGDVRYIGKSTSGLCRPRQHWANSSLAKEKTHKANWIRQLKREGCRYGIAILYAAPVALGLSDAEMFWITEGGRQGWALTNSSLGGDGPGLGHVVTNSTRQKLRASSTGRRHTAETVAAMSAFQRGRVKTAIHRQRMRDAKRDKAVAVEATNTATGEKIVFESLGEAARMLRLRKNNLCQCLAGRRKTCGSFSWRHIQS